MQSTYFTLFDFVPSLDEVLNDIQHNGTTEGHVYLHRVVSKPAVTDTDHSHHAKAYEGYPTDSAHC